MPEGSTAHLVCQSDVTNPIQAIWTKTDGSIVVEHMLGLSTPGPGYEGRVQYDESTADITITDIQLMDDDQFTCSIQGTAYGQTTIVVIGELIV